MDGEADVDDVVRIVRHWCYPPCVQDMVRVENYVRDTAQIVRAAKAQAAASSAPGPIDDDWLNRQLAARIRTEQAVRAAARTMEGKDGA